MNRSPCQSINGAEEIINRVCRSAISVLNEQDSGDHSLKVQPAGHPGDEKVSGSDCQGLMRLDTIIIILKTIIEARSEHYMWFAFVTVDSAARRKKQVLL